MHVDTPRQWTRRSLGDLLDLIRNGTTAVQTDEPTAYPVTRIETISEGVVDRSRMKYLLTSAPEYLLSRGDILYSHINSVAHIGKVAFFDDSAPLYHGMNLMLLRPRSDFVDPKFLFAVLASEYGRAHARRESKSAINQASLGQHDIASLPVLLPPLPEQHRIAEILDVADAAIRHTEALVAKLKQMKAGLLHDLLARGVDEHGQVRDPVAHPELFKDSPIGLIPRTWETPSLDDLAPEGAPICYGIVQPGPHVEDGVPVLAIRNLGGDYRTNIHKTAPAIEERYVRSRVLPSDVLLSIKGTIGQVGIVPPWFLGNISRDIARIRLLGSVSAPYVRQALLAPSSQGRLDLAVVGTTRAEVSIWILKGLEMPLPPPGEQEQIASILDDHDARTCAEEVYWDKLRLLKKGLMNDLLTGRTRVKVTEEVTG